jgi:hypothetical protein
MPSAPGQTGSPLVVETPRTLVGAGAIARTSVAASLHPLTPPGRYEGTVTVNGVATPAVLEVGERVALSLSQSELVVFAEAGEQRRRMVVTNRGNIPLPISSLGPMTLRVDQPQRSLMSRLGIVAEQPRTVRTPERDPDEPEPTVEARLDTPVELQPGDSAALDWIVEVTGALPPGVRHRATAALYTSDVTFIVTPPQKTPEKPATRERAPRARKAATTGRAASSASRQKRRKP